VETPHYDGLADWYDSDFDPTPLGGAQHEAVLRALGDGPGTLLDVGCGTGARTALLAERGWRVTGVDLSEDMLRRARDRGLDVVRADAADLPFDAASFDAVVSTWTHTDVEDFPAVAREIARVLVPGGPFVYAGGHPCFVGPHSLFRGPAGIPALHPGYRRIGRYSDGPGVVADGLRARVGATHLPLGLFVHAFLDAGLRLEHFEELELPDSEYPYMLVTRWRR
jgi:SAM-dependent methyltransferase